MYGGLKREALGGGITACVSAEHTFGIDALLLSDFSTPKKGDIACDLCAGCGIVPLFWFARGRSPTKAYAVEIQEEAHALALRSMKLSGLEYVFVPILADLRVDLPIPYGRLDLVTCNPPYRKASSGAKSASEAGQAARHETMCTINDVCAAAKRLLRFGGRLCICHLPERLPDVFSAMRENGVEPKKLRFVQNSTVSAPWLALIEGRLGGKPSLKVEPTFISYDTDGGMTEEMAEIYSLREVSQDG